MVLFYDCIVTSLASFLVGFIFENKIKLMQKSIIKVIQTELEINDYQRMKNNLKEIILNVRYFIKTLL